MRYVDSIVDRPKKGAAMNFVPNAKETAAQYFARMNAMRREFNALLEEFRRCMGRHGRRVDTVRMLYDRIYGSFLIEQAHVHADPELRELAMGISTFYERADRTPLPLLH